MERERAHALRNLAPRARIPISIHCAHIKSVPVNIPSVAGRAFNPTRTLAVQVDPGDSRAELQLLMPPLGPTYTATRAPHTLGRRAL